MIILYRQLASRTLPEPAEVVSDRTIIVINNYNKIMHNKINQQEKNKPK